MYDDSEDAIVSVGADFARRAFMAATGASESEAIASDQARDLSDRISQLARDYLAGLAAAGRGKGLTDECSRLLECELALELAADRLGRVTVRTYFRLLRLAGVRDGSLDVTAMLVERLPRLVRACRTLGTAAKNQADFERMMLAHGFSAAVLELGEPSAAAQAELLAELFDRLGERVTPQQASLLLGRVAQIMKSSSEPTGAPAASSLH